MKERCPDLCSNGIPGDNGIATLMIKRLSMLALGFLTILAVSYPQSSGGEAIQEQPDGIYRSGYPYNPQPSKRGNRFESGDRQHIHAGIQSSDYGR